MIIFFRGLFIFFLLTIMLFLLGSAKMEKKSVIPSDSQVVAASLSEALPKSERKNWENVAKKSPLWLLQISAF